MSGMGCLGLFKTVREQTPYYLLALLRRLKLYSLYIRCFIPFAGFFCTSFYHFFVHDKTGPIGVTLRLVIPTSLRFGLEDETFAAALVSLFMQVTGILQMPVFLGPDFSPFSLVGSFFERLSRKEPSLQNKPKPESKQKNSKGRTKNKEKHS